MDKFSTFTPSSDCQPSADNANSSQSSSARRARFIRFSYNPSTPAVECQRRHRRFSGWSTSSAPLSMRARSAALKRSGLSACMNRKNAGELVHANGMELSTTSSDTASFISAISSAVNGGGVYSRASRRDALSAVVVVAKLPRSDAFALDPGENASRDALALVRRDADSNFKSFPRRGASARASRISLAPSRRRRVTRRTARAFAVRLESTPVVVVVSRARADAPAPNAAPRRRHTDRPRPPVRRSANDRCDCATRCDDDSARSRATRSRVERCARDATRGRERSRCDVARRRARRDSSARFDSNSDWIKCDAIARDAIRRTRGRRRDED